MINKLVWTIIVLVAFASFSMAYNMGATLVLGQVAGDQFNASNLDYLKTGLIFNTASGITQIAGLVTLVTIGGIWFTTIKKFLAGLLVMLLCVAGISIGSTNHVMAYSDTTDKTEAYTILPNETAFWVPDVGNNKDSQVKFDSEQYLNDNKVSAKRFIIPHAKLANTGGSWGWDMYVPTGRLIIVDRTPYSREWVKSSTRGTASADQSFPCQSKEGLNVTVGVSIGSSVAPEDTAKFLYNFGAVAPTGVRNDPAVIFQSVYYGRSLSAIMDDVGRKKIQTLVCNEVASRPIDTVNAEAVPMMDNIKKATEVYFKTVGITLNFIGWADTFEFDDSVQHAINQHYIAKTLASDVQVLAAINALKVQEGLSAGLANHGLPIVISNDTLTVLQGLANTVLHK